MRPIIYKDDNKGCDDQNIFRMRQTSSNAESETKTLNSSSKILLSKIFTHPLTQSQKRPSSSFIIIVIAIASKKKMMHICSTTTQSKQTKPKDADNREKNLFFFSPAGVSCAFRWHCYKFDSSSSFPNQ